MSKGPRRTNPYPQVKSQPHASFVPLTYNIPRRRERQAQGPLQGRGVSTVSFPGLSNWWVEPVRPPRALSAAPAPSALACVLERGQLDCTNASMEMLLKCCNSQLCGAQERRCTDINNNTGHKIPATQNQSISLPLHLHTAPGARFILM